MLLDVLRSWLADSTILVKPVLDLSRTDGVDPHDPPAWMADLVRLRDPVCVFPGCHRPSRACDLDHIEPYVPIDARRPTRPDPPRQPRATLSAPPPRQDPRCMGLPPTARRRATGGPSATGRTYDVLAAAIASGAPAPTLMHGRPATP